MRSSALRTTLTESIFFREAEMAAPVMQWLRQNALIVKSEFSLPWGICDFVGVMLDPQKVQKRLSYGQKRPIGSAIRVHILSRIPDVESHTCISLKRLERELSSHISSEFLEKEIGSLLRNKFIASPKRGFFHKLNGWDPMHRRIVAVECKLSRFSDAIAQAGANRAFATESYIALPKLLALRIAGSNRREVLAQMGIGLLAVRAKTCKELIKPSTVYSAHSAVVQSHVVERFWRTRDNSP